MRNVTMQKDELRGIVRANRAKHREQFKLALEGYRLRVITELEVRLNDARKGRRIDVGIHLPTPEDHTGDYDRVIDMLKYEVKDVVELDQHEFAQYVQDNWGWKGQFLNTTQMYAR